LASDSDIFFSGVILGWKQPLSNFHSAISVKALTTNLEIMKSISRIPLASVLFLTFLALFSTCSDKCKVTNSYVYYEPVYTTAAELKAKIKFNGPQPLNTPGRIYLKDQFLLVNEAGKGIHFFDNKNPAQPRALGFLTIPGNFDLAIIGNTLYADSYSDLVAFDISIIQSIKEVNRISNLFDHSTSMGFLGNSERGILTDWKMVETVSIEENDCKRQVEQWGGIMMEDGIALTSSASATFNAKASIAPPSATGIGGSMARFTIVNNHLYALDNFFMDVVDVGVQFQPQSKTEIQVSWLAETLFPKNETLFVGTRSGMYIFDLTNPAQPNLVSQYEHVNSCDPVIVEGDYAYVTLRGGTVCNSFTNQLEVINIKDVKSPVVEKIYPMTNPHGLGIDNGILFVCDGAAGLKIFDAKDIRNITDHLIIQYDKINALDIIPFNDNAMVIGQDGLYQYDYSDLKNIRLLSKIEVLKP